MCVRCGTGRVAWCTSPDRHASEEASVPEIVLDEQWMEATSEVAGFGRESVTVQVERRVYDCKNGYGVSCMRGRPGHYASRDDGTWEVGVCHITRPGWPLLEFGDEMRDYLGESWPDVRGWQSEAEIVAAVAEVAALPAKRRTARGDADPD
jgi:hypothetical protein